MCVFYVEFDISVFEFSPLGYVWFTVRLIISGFEFSSLRFVCFLMSNLIFQYLNFHLWDMCFCACVWFSVSFQMFHVCYRGKMGFLILNFHL